MPSLGQNFTIATGDSAEIDFTATSGGSALDLTGGTVKWQLALTPSGPSLISKISPSGGITITDAPGGAFSVFLDPADTASLVPGRYYHEAQALDATSRPSTIAEGFAVIEKRLIS